MNVLVLSTRLYMIGPRIISDLRVVRGLSFLLDKNGEALIFFSERI